MGAGHLCERVDRIPAQHAKHTHKKKWKGSGIPLSLCYTTGLTTVNQIDIFCIDIDHADN